MGCAGFANPGFTLLAVLTLAVGIGVNTAMFSVVNAVLLQPLPFSEADRVVWMADVTCRQGERRKWTRWWRLGTSK